MEIRKLNTLRGLAALIVLLSHFSNTTHWLSGYLGRGAGQMGVMLFFILSGFLMAYLYLSKPFSGAAARSFLVARVARVAPLFLLVVAVSYALQQAGITRLFYTIPDLSSLASHLLLLSGDSVLWTIAAEAHFYLLFVLFWAVCARRPEYMFFIFATLMLGLVFTGFPRPDGMAGPLTFDFATAQALPYFFTGIILGYLHPRWRPPPHLQSHAFVLALLILPLLYPLVFKAIFGFPHGMWRDTGVWFAVSFVTFMVVFLVPDHNILLANPIGDFFGKISYSLYLLHMPVFILLLKLELPTAALLPLFLACATAVAYACYLLVEYPARQYLRARWSDQRAGTISVTSSKEQTPPGTNAPAHRGPDRSIHAPRRRRAA